MAKPLKFLLVLFGSLVVLVAAAIVALPFLFDPNDFRVQLGEAVKQETGREFKVGEIRLAVFPWLRVQIADAELGNAAGFGPEPMLRVQSADVGVKLLPLLREKRVEASEVKLSGVQARLAVNGDGLSNWADLLAWQQRRAEAAGEQPETGGFGDLDIAGVELQEVALTYADAQAGADYAVEKLRLRTGRLHHGEPFPVEGAMRLLSGSADAQADLEFAASVQPAPADASAPLWLKDLSVQLDGSRNGTTPAEALVAKLKLKTPGLSYDATRRLLDSGALAMEIEGLRRGTAEQPALLAKGKLDTRLLADLAQRRHELQGLVLALDLGGSALPGGKAQSLKLQTTASVDLAADSARLGGVQAEFAGLQLKSNQLLVERLGGEQPQLAGDLALAPFSPRALMASLGMDVPSTSDAKALTSASLSGRLDATATRFALQQMTLKLDDTTLRGDFAVRDLATRALAFTLKGDRLDADRYLAPRVPPAADGKPASPADKAALNATELPVKALDALNADGTLELDALKLRGVAMRDVRLRLAAPGRGLKRQQLSAALYGGRVDLALDVSDPAGTPDYALKTTLSGISAAPLLKDFLGKDYLSGTGSLQMDLRSAGGTVGAVRQALDGDVSFSFVDGAVKGFNLAKTIRQGQALLALGQGGAATAAATAEPQSTDFAELRGAGRIVKGVLKSDQLSAKNPLIRLEGAGEIDLAGETIRYLAKPTLVGTAKGQGGKEIADLAGLTVPIRISGPLFAPKVQIDWQAALQQRAAEPLKQIYETKKEELQERREELKQKAAEEINKGLLRLLGGGKPKTQEPAPAPAESAPTP